jgi:hypothetical protein
MKNSILHVSQPISNEAAALLLARIQMRLGVSDSTVTTVGSAIVIRAENKTKLEQLRSAVYLSETHKSRSVVICGRTGRVL